MNKEAADLQRVSFKKILVPLDGSLIGEAALPYAEELAIVNMAEMFLLQIVTTNQDLALAESYTSSLGQLSEEYARHAMSQATEYLNRIKERLERKRIVAHVHVEIGFPAEQIISYAREHDIDMIAMSTHGRSGVNRWLMGSIADKVMRASSVPVLMIRASGKGD